MNLFLHIGTEKTGTTTLQRFFSINKEALLDLDYCFPNEKGNNHTFLTTYAAENFDKVKDLLIYQNIDQSTSQEDFRFEIEDYLLKIVSNKKSKEKTLILTNEHCSSRLKTKHEISLLKKLFDKVGLNTKVIIYLRRQDEYLSSLYSTYIKTGGTKNLLTFLNQNKKTYRFRYYEILKLWSDIFGKKNIIIKIFEKEALLNSNIIHDFLRTIGVFDFERFDIPKGQNKSMDVNSLEFLRNLNLQMPHFIDNKINDERNAIIELLKQLSLGEKIPPNIISIKAFYDSFAESNTKVAKEFLGTPSLFVEQKVKELLSNEILEEKNDLHMAFHIFLKLWKLKSANKESRNIELPILRLPNLITKKKKFNFLKRNKNRNIFFITGLSGTGKSALYYYFLENPLKGFAFFDYDESRIKLRDSKDIDDFRIKQYHWWMDIARKTVETNKLTPVIFGHALRPLNILINPLDDFFTFKDHHFGLLTCTNEERKKRLINRGQPHLFEGHKKWHDYYLEDEKKHCEFEIDTTNLKIEEVASKVKEFLLNY